MSKLFSIAMLCLLSHAATAQTIYKCVENGAVAYHDRPCGKSAVVLDVPAATAAPEMAGRRARQRALLQEFNDARAAQAAQAAREQARLLRAGDSQRRRCDQLRLQGKWAVEDIARAAKEDIERARIKARRQAEVLAAQCPA
jgi:hypothetical protein